MLNTIVLCSIDIGSSNPKRRKLYPTVPVPSPRQTMWSAIQNERGNKPASLGDGGNDDLSSSGGDRSFSPCDNQ